MHYSADDEDGVVTVHKYDENGNEVFMREIDKASDMDTVIIKELDENGNVLKMTSYLNGEQNYLYTQVFNDHGDLIERDDEDGNPSIVYQYTYDDNGRKLSEESYTVSDDEQYLNYSTAYTYDDTHELPVTEVITNDSGVQTTTRDFDTMDVDGLYIETVSEDGVDDIVYHKRVSDKQTTYYFGQGSEVSTEYDEHGNMTKQMGKDAVMGCMESTCGALIGAVMVAGILTDGKGTPRISKELVQNFERKCGATICKDLKGIETGKVLCSCPECVRNAVLSLGEVLGE